MKTLIVAFTGVMAACAATALLPAEVRLGEDACAHCHMTLISTSTAAQIIAPGEEPVMVDDLECLHNYLAGHALANGTRVFVADHRTGEWLDASGAVFTRTAVSTPMSSGLIAHRDDASRRADAAAASGTPIHPADILPPPRNQP